MIREVRIEKLAPTGEGVARTADGVGFIDRALPGELVATNVYQVKRKFWRGSVSAVLEPSPDRIGGPHDGCAGCDWSHFGPEAARKAKRTLFLETMERLGRLEPTRFGELPVEASPAGYRLRLRLHAQGPEIGYFAPRTHRLASADACEAIAEATRALLPDVRQAIEESAASVREVAFLEDLPGRARLVRVTADHAARETSLLAERLAGIVDGVTVRDADGRLLVERGRRDLELEVGGRAFHVSADTFFQGNRFLTDVLYRAVRDAAREAAPGDALDAFGGAGLFAGALLDAGHRVTSVEGDAGASADAARAVGNWADRGRCETENASLGDYLAGDSRAFGCVVVDPPRAGLGSDLAAALARRAESLFVYVSCDPATLARDLAVLRAEGLRIRSARLFDLFAMTHRVEALVVLDRAA